MEKIRIRDKLPITDAQQCLGSGTKEASGPDNRRENKNIKIKIFIFLHDITVLLPESGAAGAQANG
jgi:hypothetical protein